MSVRGAIIFLLAIMVACGPLDDSSEVDEDIVAKGVEIKMAQYLETHERQCREKAIDIALKRVDSLVKSGELIPPVDPVIKPDKPVKPERPPVKTLPDTVSHQLIREARDSIN